MAFEGMIFAAIGCGCTVVPWLLSLIATMIYQHRKRKVLLERESATNFVSGDALSTLSKPLGNREIREFRMMMSSVVMSPSWVQMWIGGIISSPDSNEVKLGRAASLVNELGLLMASAGPAKA